MNKYVDKNELTSELKERVEFLEDDILDMKEGLDDLKETLRDSVAELKAVKEERRINWEAGHKRRMSKRETIFQFLENVVF